MSFINDISISISVGALAVTGRSFDPLIIGIASGVQVASGISFAQSTPGTFPADMLGYGYLATDPEYLMVSAMFEQNTPPALVNVYRAASSYLSSGGYNQALTDLSVINNSWYYILITSRNKTDLQAAGAYAGVNNKFFIGCTSDLTAFSGRNQNREMYLFDTTPAQYSDAAWVGYMAPLIPGSANWKWKVLDGMSSPSWTVSQLLSIRAGNCASLQLQGGQIFTNNGAATSGQSAQMTQGMDYINNALQVAILELMLSNNNVPEDDTGFAQLEGTIRSTLSNCGQLGLIQAVNPALQSDMNLSDDKHYKYTVTNVAYNSLTTAQKVAGASLFSFTYYANLGINSVAVTGLVTL